MKIIADIIVQFTEEDKLAMSCRLWKDPTSGRKAARVQLGAPIGLVIWIRDEDRQRLREVLEKPDGYI